jgi:hypothetical protein
MFPCRWRQRGESASRVSCATATGSPGSRRVRAPPSAAKQAGSIRLLSPIAACGLGQRQTSGLRGCDSRPTEPPRLVPDCAVRNRVGAKRGQARDDFEAGAPIFESQRAHLKRAVVQSRRCRSGVRIIAAAPWPSTSRDALYAGRGACNGLAKTLPLHARRLNCVRWFWLLSHMVQMDWLVTHSQERMLCDSRLRLSMTGEKPI